MSRRVRRPKGDRTNAADKNVCGAMPLRSHVDLEIINNPEVSSLRNFAQRLSTHPRYFHKRGERWPPSPPPPPPSPPIQPNSFGRLVLKQNETETMALRLPPHRLSTTTNLLQVARRGADGQRCAALLGVGHLRRREGDCTAQARPPQPLCRPGPNPPPPSPSAMQYSACSLFAGRNADLPPFRYGYQCAPLASTALRPPPLALWGPMIY